MQSHAEASLKRLLEGAIPAYQVAPGLSGLTVLWQSLVGYEEITVVTIWQSEEHMKSFFESSAVSSSSRILI